VRGSGKEEVSAADGSAADIRKLKEQMARQQQLIDELLAERSGSSAADTFRTPISTSVKRSARRAIVEGDGEDGELGSAAHGRGAGPAVGPGGMTLRDVLSNLKGYVTPFYADSKEDKGRTVLQFVNNVETAMGNLLLDPKSPHRLMIVQLCLRDNALQWMNRKLEELTDAQDKGWHHPPLTWDADLRRPFIKEHLGSDTPELWIAKLRTLRLGDDGTRTPIELDNQFDSIARHVFPNMVAGDDSTELALSTYYGEIVAESSPFMYKNIMRSSAGGLRTVKKWKEALANAVIAEAHISAFAARKQNSKSADSGNQRGGHRGRGGYGRQSEVKPHSVSAMDTSSDRGEGEEETVQPNDQQLTAVQSGRGGRGGGRGGRGRGGGARPAMSAEKQKLYNEQRCFRCHEVGHTVAGCPKPPKPQQQGKVTADE
jgi:hypothetical protein